MEINEKTWLIWFDSRPVFVELTGDAKDVTHFVRFMHEYLSFVQKIFVPAAELDIIQNAHSLFCEANGDMVVQLAVLPPFERVIK